MHGVLLALDYFAELKVRRKVYAHQVPPYILGGGFRGCILQSIEISIKQILGKREKHIDGDGVNERGEEKV